MSYDRWALKVTGISNFLLCNPLRYNPPATNEKLQNLSQTWLDIQSSLFLWISEELDSLAEKQKNY